MLEKSKVTVGLVISLESTYFQKIRNTIKSPYGKGNLELLYASRGSFIAPNNPSGFDCFYLVENN